MWLCTIRYISKCEIDVRYYPLDEQKCDLRFGSWSQEATKVGGFQGFEIFSLYAFVIISFASPSSTCSWAKASAGRKSSTCSQQAKNLSFVTLKVIVDWWSDCVKIKNPFFQEEEKSLRTLAAKISLPMWSTQSDCGGDQQERISLKYFLQMSEMRSDEIVIGFHFQTTNLLYDQLHSSRYPDQCQYFKTTNKCPRIIPADL